MRRAHGVWLNLNSTNTWGPQLIPDAELAAFLDALHRQGLSVHEVAAGEWVHLEWLAAEISVQADWRGLPSDPYDFEDARGVAHALVEHLRDRSS